MRKICSVDPMRLIAVLSTLTLTTCTSMMAPAQRSRSEIDAFAKQAMAATGAKGLAIAVVERGTVVHVGAYGVRNERAEPLETSTIMYGASLTKTAFAYMVMQLVEQGALDLDRPIADYLPRPLPDYPRSETIGNYAPWADLAGDERWRSITPRVLLTHSAGFSNFAFVEPDGKLRMHFDPGARYAYSGEGFILLQFVLEKGLGLDVGAEMQRRVFDRFGMANTSMTWRPDFAHNLADGWDKDGTAVPHDKRSRVRAAGSMDTTIADMAKLAAGYVAGANLSRASRAELTKGQVAITSRTQFPSLQPELPVTDRRGDVVAGLGVIGFNGPQGRGFFKGGHNDTTANTWVCIERSRRCVVILANDVRAESAFPAIVRFVLGETNVPWEWEYGEMKFWTPE